MAHLKIKTDKGLQYIGDKRIDDIKTAGVLTTDGNGGLESKEIDSNFQRPLEKFSGIVKQVLNEDGTNSFSSAEVNVDYQSPLNDVEGLLKSQSDKQIYLAEPETDYCPATQIVVKENSTSEIITLDRYTYYDISMLDSSTLTINYSATANSIDIAHGMITFAGNCVLTLNGFSKIKGFDGIVWDEATKIGTYTVPVEQVWEFSSLNGYLVLKNWSED